MNKKKGIVTAAIIVIGNEILSGRTQDLNVSLIAKWLNNLGITLYEVRIIPDIEKTIVNTINNIVDNKIKNSNYNINETNINNMKKELGQFYTKN